jgi:hypothetical protein
MTTILKKENKIVKKKTNKEIESNEQPNESTTESSEVIDVFSNKTSSSSSGKTYTKSSSDEHSKFCICLDKIYRVLGYKEKRLALKLLNGKYNFQENIDYKIKNTKTMITNECYRLLCLLSKTEMGDKYRRYIINNIDNIELGPELYKIEPMPEVNLNNIKKYDNKRLFFMINIRDTKYVYGITTDILMLLDLLNEQYNTIIINKLWLLSDKLDQVKIMTEINKELGDESKYQKYEKIKSCIEVDDIYELLLKMNNIFIKLNSI